MFVQPLQRELVISPPKSRWIKSSQIQDMARILNNRLPWEYHFKMKNTSRKTCHFVFVGIDEILLLFVGYDSKKPCDWLAKSLGLLVLVLGLTEGMPHMYILCLLF